MKKSLILLLLLAGLVGLAVVTKKQKEARLSENTRRGVSTREYLIPDLDVNAVKSIKIQDKDGSVTLKQGEKEWVVVERNNYGVDFGKISQSLMELRETKIAGKQLLGKGAWADENVLEPAEGVKEGVGTLVKLMDEKGTDLAALVLGGDVKVSGGNAASPMDQAAQRLVRIPQDEDSLWMVGSTFSSFKAKPEEWLDKTFVILKDLASVTVTAPVAADSWKASRASIDATDYILEGLKEGEEFDPAKLPLASLLTSASFNDVKPLSEAGDLLKGAHKATLKTFDGFTYDLQVAKVPKDGADKYFMTLAVKADLPKARTPGKDEKEEDKKRLDEEFKAAQDALKEKLENEKKLEKWVFEVAEYTVNNLLIKRGDLIKKPEPPAPAGTPSAPGAPPAPPAAPSAAAPTPPSAEAPMPPAIKAPVTVTTPPVAVPPVPKVEVKPAPAADANPAEVPPPPAKP